MHTPATRLRLTGLFTCLTGASFLLTGCGGGNGSNDGTTPAGPTSANVVLMLTSTGNDRLTSFNTNVTSLTLTSHSGSTVSLFTTQPYAGEPEFHHLNGLTEPYVTTTIPTDTYTSATITLGGAQFSCTEEITGMDGGLNNDTYAYGTVPANQVTITLPTPLVINTDTGLALDLQEAASATFPSCVQTGVSSYSINPTFQLQALPFGNLLNASANGEPTTIRGLVASVTAGGGSLNVALPDGPNLAIATESDTTFQGIANAATLAVGQPVEIDLVFGTNGAPSAHRIAVPDPDTTTLSTALGAIESVASSQPTFGLTATQLQGVLYDNISLNGGQFFSFGSATFAISGIATNLQQLPFTPTFTAGNLVPGQNVFLTSHATTIGGGPLYVPAATVTLEPQTVNATVTGIATSGTTTTYTVSLASYDLFNNLATQPGQANLIANPGTMTIHSTGNTGLQTLTVGQPYRFTGLVFNDNGALRMDCLQILAGVTP